ILEDAGEDAGQKMPGTRRQRVCSIWSLKVEGHGAMLAREDGEQQPALPVAERPRRQEDQHGETGDELRARLESASAKTHACIPGAAAGGKRASRAGPRKGRGSIFRLTWNKKRTKWLWKVGRPPRLRSTRWHRSAKEGF